MTSYYRLTICNRFNLRSKTPNFIPIYFHNLSAYDQAYIIGNLHVLKGCETHIIPANKERFISISVRVNNIWLRFLDSYRMMPESLEKLVNNQPEQELVESKKIVPTNATDLVRSKGIYPYDYVSSEKVFSETKLPGKA